MFGYFLLIAKMNFEGLYKYNGTEYEFANTQLTLSAKDELYPGTIAYGSNGVITGDDSLYKNLDEIKALNTFLGADINAMPSKYFYGAENSNGLFKGLHRYKYTNDNEVHNMAILNNGIRLPDKTLTQNTMSGSGYDVSVLGHLSHSTINYTNDDISNSTLNVFILDNKNVAVNVRCENTVSQYLQYSFIHNGELYFVMSDTKSTAGNTVSIYKVENDIISNKVYSCDIISTAIITPVIYYNGYLYLSTEVHYEDDVSRTGGAIRVNMDTLVQETLFTGLSHAYSAQLKAFLTKGELNLAIGDRIIKTIKHIIVHNDNTYEVKTYDTASTPSSLGIENIAGIFEYNGATYLIPYSQYLDNIYTITNENKVEVYKSFSEKFPFMKTINELDNGLLWISNTSVVVAKDTMLSLDENNYVRFENHGSTTYMYNNFYRAISTKLTTDVNTGMVYDLVFLTDVADTDDADMVAYLTSDSSSYDEEHMNIGVNGKMLSFTEKLEQSYDGTISPDEYNTALDTSEQILGEEETVNE